MTHYDDGEVSIRNMRNSDLADLQKLSPPDVKPVIQFSTYVTLVAEIGGFIVGYTQFCITPDGILHSYAIRISAEHKGHGIGSKLLETKERIAKQAGAKQHMYLVDKNGEEALKKILLKMGMHLCIERENVQLYMKGLA